jgi:DNA-binding transcriptional regulator LsrR (DeoR family)
MPGKRTAKKISELPHLRRRQELTPGECRRIAVARYRPEGGQLPEWKELSPRFHGRDETTLRRAIKRAFEEGLVKIIEVPRPLAECPRDTKAETALREKFRGLHAPIVVDTAPILQHEFPTPNTSESEEVDDEVHRILGYTMAKTIAQGFIFQDDTVLGLGAGRGVYYTLEALLAEPPLTPENITVMSLTGVVRPSDYMRSLTIPLDADYHCWLLAKCFRSKIGLQQVWLPITHTDATGTPLSADSWGKLHPDCVLSGVGVFGPGHRFYEAAQSEPDDILAPIHAELKTLVKLCGDLKTVTKSTYNPIGDICHKLFYVEPPPGIPIDFQQESRIRKAIDKTNERLLNISENQLQSVKTIVLVAGTERKALAIRELLKGGLYKIHYLCTDKKAAARILQ